MLHDVISIVGLVGHENDRAIGLCGDGKAKVGMAGVGVVGAAEPEAGAVAFDRDILVDQDGDALAGEGMDDERRAD